MRIDYQIAKSKLNVRTAENTALPQLDAVGSYSRTQNDGGFGAVTQPDGSAWSLGLTYSIPIGNVAALSALSKAKIDHESLRRQRIQQIRQIELDVRTAVIKLNNSLARRPALEAVLDQARQLEAVAKSRFSRGLATNLDITEAHADIRDAETDLLTATIDYNVGLAELEAAIAGPL